jgi:hypothetical protein
VRFFRCKNLHINLILNHSPQEKDFQKEEIKCSPRLLACGEGPGVRFFRCKNLRLNLILNHSPQEKDFQKEEIKCSPRLWRGAGGEVF